MSISFQFYVTIKLFFNGFIYAFSYVDTCKYDSNDINISCKHVKSSLEFGSTKAKVLKIELTTLNSFQLNDKEKQKLCKLYEESEKTVPLVQRISQTVFVVRCDVNFNFPAGLLHVVCNEDAKRARFVGIQHQI